MLGPDKMRAEAPVPADAWRLPRPVIDPTTFPPPGATSKFRTEGVAPPLTKLILFEVSMAAIFVIFNVPEVISVGPVWVLVLDIVMSLPLPTSTCTVPAPLMSGPV